MPNQFFYDPAVLILFYHQTKAKKQSHMGVFFRFGLMIEKNQYDWIIKQNGLALNDPQVALYGNYRLIFAKIMQIQSFVFALNTH